MEQMGRPTTSQGYLLPEVHVEASPTTTSLWYMLTAMQTLHLARGRQSQPQG